MPRNSLRRLGRTYPDTLVGMERFGRLLEMPSAALRARRTPDGRFPKPAGSGPTSRYPLDELVKWAESVGLADRADDDEVQVFALECAVRLCSRLHGSEAALRFLGGAALFVSAGWRPTASTEWSIAEQLRRDDPPRRVPRLSKPLFAGGFRPDVDPACDPAVWSRTINWRTSGRSGFAIPNDSIAASLIIEEVRSTWSMTERARSSTGSGHRNLAFAREIDRHLLHLFGSGDRRSNLTPPMVSSTMAALAPLSPGSLVCDPAMGAATTLIELVMRSDSARTQTIGVIGRDMDEMAWTVAKIRLGLRDIAHELGRHGGNSLDPNELQGPFDVVVCEPSARRRNYGEWFEMSRRLLRPDGTAVLALPADVLSSDFRTGKWWQVEAGHLETLVVTPAPRSSRRGPGWVVCASRADPTGSDAVRTMVVEPSNRQLQLRERSQMDDDERELAPMDRAQIDEIAAIAVAADDRSEPELGIVTRSISNRPTDISTLIDQVLDRRWVRADLTPVGSTRSRRHDRHELEPETNNPSERAVRRVARQGDDADADAEPTLDQALGAVDLLRWLTDPDPEIDELTLDPATRASLAGESTEEIRRALKRLRQRLLGEETRGRRKQTDTTY